MPGPDIWDHIYFTTVVMSLQVLAMELYGVQPFVLLHVIFYTNRN